MSFIKVHEKFFKYFQVKKWLKKFFLDLEEEFSLIGLDNLFFIEKMFSTKIISRDSKIVLFAILEIL